MARKNQKAPWEPEEEIIWVSKTELKRDMEELQKLGEELVSLKPSVLEKFPLSDDLRDAIKDAQRFTKEARRRQLQYIGKIMRNEDTSCSASFGFDRIMDIIVGATFDMVTCSRSMSSMAFTALHSRKNTCCPPTQVMQ